MRYVFTRPVLWGTPLTALVIEDTDVLYLKLATVDFVVLTSSEAISDLFEKRSKIYSDRVSSLANLPRMMVERSRFPSA